MGVGVWKVRDKQAGTRIAGVNVENKEKMEGLACQTEVRGSWLALLYLQTNIGCRGVSDMHASAKAQTGPVPWLPKEIRHIQFNLIFENLF